ncbi:hypothetical protein L7F22_048912 [Adiantum nelumboides]|nr:hypothetical protein [Adiantum nelumboides]
MSEPVNLRVSRSGFSVRSSPTRNMPNAKDRQTPPSKMDTGTGTNTGTRKDTGAGTEKSVLCSMQDISGFISSLQEMVMKQGEDIKNLALKNQELEHTIQIQNLKMQHQDEKIQALQDAFNKQVSNVQDALATHDEKLAHISDNATGNTTSWAHVVRSTPNAIPQTHETYANVDDTEYNEREKCSMNIVIRGIPESDNEKILMLNAEVTDLLANTFGMHDVVVYGAHRVGKQRPENYRAIPAFRRLFPFRGRSGITRGRERVSFPYPFRLSGHHGNAFWECLGAVPPVRGNYGGSSIDEVLMQDGRVVAYESRILQGAEKTMQVYEKELQAVIHALLSWKHYLLGADFVVQTDHQTLRYFLTQAKLSEKHMRWANILSMFHFQIVHVEGKKNVVAYALSRKPQISAVSIPYHHELHDTREQYANDEDFARIFEQLVDGQRHEHYLLKDGFMMMHGRLCVTRPLRRKVMEESLVPPYAGHRGIDATVKAVETFFYWPTLRRDVDAFVRECIFCEKVKFDRQKAPGLLQPLPIPDKPWESIAVDFIFDLPRTQTGNDGVWTIICRFRKQAHFIHVRKKIKPDQMARLFMSNIFKYHGMPQSIVSDRDPRMTSLFWRGLFENMGTTLKFSSSFHPQTDGQSEEANSTVLDLLKCYVSEHKGKWEQYLPLVEYAYNNTVHSSTGKAPFEIVEGGKKVPPILHTKDKIFEADKYVQNMGEMYKKVKVALEKTQAKQKKAADRHCREVVFSLGDWVLLRFDKARLKMMKSKERSLTLKPSVCNLP